MCQHPDRPSRRLPTWTTAFALAALFAGLGLAATPAAAEVFHVDLANGERFDTLHRPEEASWDTDLILLLTDTGSWIAVEKAEVVSIVAETEASGYGRVVDTSTIVLGYAANDAPLPEDQTQFSAIQRLQQLFEQQGQGQDYTVEQFVEPGQAGRNTGGLPAYGATSPSDLSYVSGAFSSPPAVSAPAPAPSAPLPGALPGTTAVPPAVSNDPVDQ